MRLLRSSSSILEIRSQFLVASRRVRSLIVVVDVSVPLLVQRIDRVMAGLAVALALTLLLTGEKASAKMLIGRGPSQTLSSGDQYNNPFLQDHIFKVEKLHHTNSISSELDRTMAWKGGRSHLRHTKYYTVFISSLLINMG